MKKIFLLFGILAVYNYSLADVHYAVTLQGRNLPTGLNLFGMAAYDALLWGGAENGNPLYGYYRLGLKAGGNPTYAAFMQVAPIAPLIFEIQKGTTHRFVKIATIDCDANDCKGRIDRTDYSARLIGAYANFVLSVNAMWREIQTSDNSISVGLEQEYFVVTPGFHRYFETTVMTGYQMPENKFIGVLLNNGILSEGNRRNSSAYILYQTHCEDYSLTGGIGNYKSDATGQDGFSAIFSVTKSWGSKLSLDRTQSKN